MQKRTRFVRINVYLFARFHGGADYSERGAVTSGGKGSRVAMCQDASACGHERGSVTAHGLVRGDVFGVHALRFLDQRLLNLRNSFATQRFKFLRHAADRPEKIYGSGPRLTHVFADPSEFRL